MRKADMTKLVSLVYVLIYVFLPIIYPDEPKLKVADTTALPCDWVRMQKRPLRIACLGDSITLGGSRIRSQRGNYPMLLHKLLAGPKNDTAMASFDSYFDVRNFGRSGATACDASDTPYIKSKELVSAIEFRPDLIVIMLGTNDAKGKFWENENGDSGCGGEEAYLAGMRQILRAVGADLNPAAVETVEVFANKAYSPKVLIVPPPDVIESRRGIHMNLLPNVRESLPDLVAGSEGFSTIRSFENSGDGCDEDVRLASELFIPTHPKLFINDMVHLSREGSSILACSIFVELIDWCGAMDGILGSSSSPDVRGGVFGQRKSPRRADCAGKVKQELLSAWERSAEKCRKMMSDPVMNTGKNKPI